MKLKSYYLTEKQIKTIKREAKRRKVSQAEIIRIAVDNYIKKMGG